MGLLVGPAGQISSADQLDGPVLFIWSLGQFAYSKIFLSVCSWSQLPSQTKALFIYIFIDLNRFYIFRKHWGHRYEPQPFEKIELTFILIFIFPEKDFRLNIWQSLPLKYLKSLNFFENYYHKFYLRKGIVSSTLHTMVTVPTDSWVCVSSDKLTNHWKSLLENRVLHISIEFIGNLNVRMNKNKLGLKCAKLSAA